MRKPSIEIVSKAIDEASQAYHKLVLVVGPSGAGKTNLLRQVQRIRGAELLNVGLEVSWRMLDIARSRRPLKVAGVFAEIADRVATNPIVLDNIEVLFERSFKLHPLNLLQNLSKNKVVVSSWNGSLEGDYLTYGVPNHPEYKRYPRENFFLVNLNQYT